MDHSHLVVAPAPAGAVVRAPQRTRPQRPLPTDRIAFPQQPAVLQSLGRLSSPAKRPVDSTDLGGSLHMASGTAGLLPRFFVDAGWAEKAGKGRYIATDSLLEYVRHVGVEPEAETKAAAFLATAFQQSWYWQAVEHQLVVTGSMLMNDAIIILMKEAGATPAHRDQLENVFAWMEYVGLVVLEEDTLRLAYLSNGSLATGTTVNPASDVDLSAMLTPRTGTAVSESTTPHEFVVSFSVAVNLTADDLKGLSPEQVTAMSEAIGTLAAISARR